MQSKERAYYEQALVKACRALRLLVAICYQAQEPEAADSYSALEAWFANELQQSMRMHRPARPRPPLKAFGASSPPSSG